MGLKLKINLKKLSTKGLDISYNQKLQELTQKLRPLVGNNDYEIKIHIKDAGLSSYTVSGNIQTRLNLLCARCSYDFKKDINKNFKEKLLLQKTLERIDKPVRNNHFSELANTENWNIINQSLFDIGDFLYELIAIEEPLRPLGSKDCDKEQPQCEHLQKIKQKINKSKKSQVHFS